MTDFLIYQGKAAVALAVFYMFYRLLLSKETFHRFNRIVLLGTAALSFILPLCVITFKKVVVLPAMTTSSETVLGEVAGTAVTMVPEASEPIWPIILCIIFCIGALTVLTNTVISIIGIRRIISSGSSQTLESGETLIITETDTAPFSWMKYIVISRESGSRERLLSDPDSREGTHRPQTFIRHPLCRYDHGSPVVQSRNMDAQGRPSCPTRVRGG